MLIMFVHMLIMSVHMLIMVSRQCIFDEWDTWRIQNKLIKLGQNVIITN